MASQQDTRAWRAELKDAMRKSRRLKKAFERAGPDMVRTLLLHGYVNPAGLSPELMRIHEPSEERSAALHWLRKKERAATARTFMLDVIALITMFAACIAAWPIIKAMVPTIKATIEGCLMK
jgi:hypothetical protein